MLDNDWRLSFYLKIVDETLSTVNSSYYNGLPEMVTISNIFVKDFPCDEFNGVHFLFENVEMYPPSPYHGTEKETSLLRSVQITML